MRCDFFKNCSGCHDWDSPLNEQHQLKKQFLSELMKDWISAPSISSLSIPEIVLRDRVDLQIRPKKWGLFQKPISDCSTFEKSVLDLPYCPLMSSALSEFYFELRALIPLFDPLFQKASFRLRVGPGGLKGLWIDAANIEIKNFLSNTEILFHLEKICKIEIGQKRKTPFYDSNQKKFRLKENQLDFFWEGLIEENFVPLYAPIGGFTQPSLLVSRKINLKLQEIVKKIKPHSVIELGAGIGALSFPFLNYSNEYFAIEKEASLSQSFIKNLQHYSLSSKAQILNSDFLNFQKHECLKKKTFDILFLNPPRSGLPNLENILESVNVHNIIYLSCNPLTMVRDLKALKNKMTVEEILLIDQFSHSQHLEALVWLKGF